MSQSSSPAGGIDAGFAWLRPSLLLSAIAGAALASVIVYAYYNDPFRPLAHTLGPWVALSFALSWRRTPAAAIAHTIAGLGCAVITFYLGLKIGHDIRWSAKGSVMTVNWADMQLWVLFSVVGGLVLGFLGSRASRRDWIGAATAAAFIGLLLADGFRRALVWGLLAARGGWDAAVLLDGALAILVFLVATRDNRRPWLTVAFVPLVAVVGAVVVAVPDAIEQLLV